MYLIRWQLFVLKGRRLCKYLALARASTDEDKDEGADLDWVDADKDAEYEAFLKELYLPSN